MSPLKALIGLVSLLFGAFFPSKKTAAWPDGEQPLIEDDRLLSVPGWLCGGFDEESSARSGSASLAGVDPHAEGPTPGRAHTLGVGHPNVTAGLLISAAIGIRLYAGSDACEKPTYWRNIADQLDPK